MASERDAQRRLLAAIDRLEPSLRRQVLRALDSLRGAVSLDALARALELGDQLALERLISQLSRALQRAARTVQDAFQVGRSAAAQSRTSIRAALDTTNPFALRAAERTAAQLVTNVTSETRAAIRVVVTAAIEQGLTPREAARLIRPMFGLTQRQAQAVLNQRARDEARGLDADRIAARAQAYADRLLRRRAEMIARTELMRASNSGQLEIWRDAQQQGLLGPNARKKWLVADDDRLCPACEALSGETVLLGEMFSAGVEAPPLHPNCRCTLVLAVQAVRRAA